MPHLSKKALSVFLRNGCERQLRLLLYTNAERTRHSMPPNQIARAGLGRVGQAGDEWQAEKVNELRATFGQANVYCGPVTHSNSVRPDPMPLADVIGRLSPFQYVVEADFNVVSCFVQEYGLDDIRDEFGDALDVGTLRPDIVQVLPPNYAPEMVDVNGRRHHRQPQGVALDGSLFDLSPSDTRLRLRVIDVKLTAEPGANYFAEVVLYSLALAGWLSDNGLEQRFVVSADAAVWPGNYDASALSIKLLERHRGALVTDLDLAQAMEADLEIAEFSVFVPRLRQLLERDLPRVLSQHWNTLEWHTDYRCLGCEFLGLPWRDRDGNRTESPLHCWQEAGRIDHLSRIAGLTRGAARILRQRASTVADVAALSPNDSVFTRHQTLRARSTVWTSRAQSFGNNGAFVIPTSGTSAVMPRRAHLRVWMTFDYDPSSAITAVMSLRAKWIEPTPFGMDRQRQTQNWGHANEPIVGLIDKRDPATEGREFLRFLQHLQSIFDHVIDNDAQRQAQNSNEPPSTYQIYLWDEAQLRHLQRLIGRHLDLILRDGRLRDLAWLMPPDDLMPRPEQASRRSPITLISNVVQSHLAVPVPHHYTLLEVVKHYSPAFLRHAPTVHPLYEDPLSNLVPAERIHEYWGRSSNWITTQDILQETSRQKTFSLALITERLQIDLAQSLSDEAAPVLGDPPRRLTRVTDEGQLWFQHTRLNVALQELDLLVTYAMPAYEREARFKAAWLTRRIDDSEERAIVLASVNQACGTNLTATADLMVYELAPGSCEVNIRAGDLALALSPRNDPSFLNRKVRSLPQADTYASTGDFQRNIAVGSTLLTRVDLVAIDRRGGFVALRITSGARFTALEAAGINFSTDVMLDKVPFDSLVKKIRQTVEALGLPASAVESPIIQRAIGARSRADNNRVSRTDSAAARALYRPVNLHATTITRDIPSLRKALESEGVSLNKSQWEAWHESLTRHLALIWGPPGTGKSETLRAIIRGVIHDASTHNRSLRVLVTANTYTAIDNVFLKLETALRTSADLNASSLVRPSFFRLRSHFNTPEVDLAADHPWVTDISVNRANPDACMLDMRGRLDTPQGIMIVAAPPQQLYNLAFSGRRESEKSNAVQSWFDFILVDEASQMDVANSLLVWTKMANDGSVVLAGDDLQLAPIHQADPPRDLEAMVGSIYSFMRTGHGIEPSSLDVNYRSNHTITDFVKLAGYSSELESWAPNLRLNLSSVLSDVQQPANWPTSLMWCSGLNALLNPSHSTVCFVYDDQISGQSNTFEAQIVTGLVSLLHGRLAQPAGARDRNGQELPLCTTAYADHDFWSKGIGVVTPHRAQVGRIVDELTRAFGTSVPYADITSAVDTVERYQGQERDVIIASFAVGDPDTIRGEDAFLYNLNRFNVMASRAKVKLIVLVTKTLLDHLSDDADVLRESALFKRYAESYCSMRRPLTLTWLDENGVATSRTGELREK